MLKYKPINLTVTPYTYGNVKVPLTATLDPLPDCFWTCPDDNSVYAISIEHAPSCVFWKWVKDRLPTDHACITAQLIVAMNDKRIQSKMTALQRNIASDFMKKMKMIGTHSMPATEYDSEIIADFVIKIKASRNHPSYYDLMDMCSDLYLTGLKVVERTKNKKGVGNCKIGKQLSPGPKKAAPQLQIGLLLRIVMVVAIMVTVLAYVMRFDANTSYLRLVYTGGVWISVEKVRNNLKSLAVNVFMFQKKRSEKLNAQYPAQTHSAPFKSWFNLIANQTANTVTVNNETMKVNVFNVLFVFSISQYKNMNLEEHFHSYECSGAFRALASVHEDVHTACYASHTDKSVVATICTTILTGSYDRVAKMVLWMASFSIFSTPVALPKAKLASANAQSDDEHLAKAVVFFGLLTDMLGKTSVLTDSIIVILKNSLMQFELPEEDYLEDKVLTARLIDNSCFMAVMSLITVCAWIIVITRTSLFCALFQDGGANDFPGDNARSWQYDVIFRAILHTSKPGDQSQARLYVVTCWVMTYGLQCILWHSAIMLKVMWNAYFVCIMVSVVAVLFKLFGVACVCAATGAGVFGLLKTVKNMRFDVGNTIFKVFMDVFCCLWRTVMGASFSDDVFVPVCDMFFLLHYGSTWFNVFLAVHVGFDALMRSIVAGTGSDACALAVVVAVCMCVVWYVKSKCVSCIGAAVFATATVLVGRILVSFALSPASMIEVRFMAYEMFNYGCVMNLGWVELLLQCVVAVLLELQKN